MAKCLPGGGAGRGPTPQIQLNFKNREQSTEAHSWKMKGEEREKKQFTLLKIIFFWRRVGGWLAALLGYYTWGQTRIRRPKWWWRDFDGTGSDRNIMEVNGSIRGRGGIYCVRWSEFMMTHPSPRRWYWWLWYSHSNNDGYILLMKYIMAKYV